MQNVTERKFISFVLGIVSDQNLWRSYRMECSGILNGVQINSPLKSARVSREVDPFLTIWRNSLSRTKARLGKKRGN